MAEVLAVGQLGFQIFHTLAQKLYFQIQGMFMIDIAAPLAYNGAVWGHIAQYHGARTQLAVMPDMDRSKDSGARTDYNIIADFTSFAYNNARAVVDENAVADDGPRVDFDACEKAG